MAALSTAPLSSSRPYRHRKRLSVSRGSSDTTASLPPYKPSLLSVEPFEQPPDYPDSAEEADEESDVQSILLSPPISPRRRRFFRSGSVSQSRNYVNPASQSDTFLDKILERSVAALELSNSLLQTSMSTNSSVSNVLASDPAASDRMLDTQARVLTNRIRDNHGVHERWMDDLDDLSRDVKALYDDDEPGPSQLSTGTPDISVSRSLPSSGLHRKQPVSSPNLQRRRSSITDSGRLRLSPSEQHRLQALPPRALTQYVSVGADFESTSDASPIFLPSTLGLRAAAHLSDFNLSSPSPSTSTLSPPSPSFGPSAYSSLARHASSPSPSKSPRTSRSSSRTPTYRQRSRSRSSNQPASPQLVPRLIPSPIEELPSQSDSSTSESIHPYRTVESLRKILDEQPMSPDPKAKQPESRSPAFTPRTPPVTPVTSTSTTTTSISRLFTKGAHSTSTRAPSPPRHSSLKQRSSAPPSIQTDTFSPNLNISELTGPASASASGASSGRSTPRTVAFGPLPESYAGSKPGGAPTKFQEQKEAKAKAKARSKSKAGGGKGRKDGENSWWTTWLTGGSVLSMSATRQEEHADDRFARSWGRPGLGFDDWAV
ncbi:hypothetical protein DFH11DRAFT_1567303 [Phellopilus nigrolimitatus]|nr:hypothetical protein DFH11DRAFT_1567303 [Phellopilus nigrolimitatus]